MSVEQPSIAIISELSERSRAVFSEIVTAYMETGGPVGSRTLSRRLDIGLSPASIRNVMADLEAAGLLFAPHTSAGRLPTEAGLRLFVDGLLEIGNLTEEERASIEGRCHQVGRNLESVLAEASDMLSGLSQCAGVVIAPKSEAAMKHIEFVALGDERAIVVTVTEGGMVENRIVDLPPGLPPSALIEAGNYLNARLRGRTLTEARSEITGELEQKRAELDELSAKVVADGLAMWGGDERATLIVRGHSNLLDDVNAIEDLERIRRLFDDLENAEEVIKLLDLTHEAEGVRIFIGSENKLFSMSGSSLIVAPYSDSRQKVVGAIGVIGPTHLNYARIVPMVDYTAQVIGRMMG